MARFSHVDTGSPEDCCAFVDVCLDAMEVGKLSVLAKHNKLYLWEYVFFSVDQWVRVCALLQRTRLVPRLLWSEHGNVCWVRSRVDSSLHYVTEDPVARAVLCEMEYLWQDLHAVQKWIKSRRFSPLLWFSWDYQWVQAEVEQRLQWSAGLRVAWLRAVVVFAEAEFLMNPPTWG